MKVYKAGEVCEGELILSVPTDKRFDIISTLFNLQPAVDSNPSSAWRVGIDIGKGAERKNILLDLPPVFSESLSLNEPIFFADFKFVFFRSRLFISERAPRNSSEREEIVLRIKKYLISPPKFRSSSPKSFDFWRTESVWLRGLTRFRVPLLRKSCSGTFVGIVACIKLDIRVA